MYITFERFATMGAELSIFTEEKDENPNITNRFFVKSDKETIVVVYTNPPNETYSKPSSSFRFTKGDDLMFCLNALKHAGFHPYKSNGIDAGFSFIGEENTFPKMAAMKATLGPGDKTCFWNAITATLNIPNKCLTFEEIENLFSEIKRDNTIQPVFTKNEEDFPVIPNSRTSTPVVEEPRDSAFDVVEEIPTSAPVVVEETPTLEHAVVEETPTSAPAVVNVKETPTLALVGVKKDALCEKTINFPSATVKVDNIHAKLIRDGNGGLGTINIRDTGYAIYFAMYPVKNGNILCACISINGIQCQVVY